MPQLKKIILPVGGLGTRFLPATKSLPKEMLPVYNKPLIQYAYDEAIKANIDEFIFITGRNKNAINNHFDHAYELETILNKDQKHSALSLTKGWLPQAGKIAFIRQQQPLGLGHAIWCARNFINNEAFAVTLADELLQSEISFMQIMQEAYNKLPPKSNLLGVYKVPKNQVSNYGIIEIGSRENDVIKVKSMIEKPSIDKAPSQYAIIGRYILQAEILDILENTKAGKNNEIQLTDALNNLLKEQNFYAIECNGKRFDCGSPAGWVDANISFAEASLDQKIFKDIINKYI